MKGLREKLAKKWFWLRAQAGFQKEPVLTIFRLISWGTLCLFQRGATVKLERWNVRMFLPARWKGIEKLIFVFREDYESELAYLDRALSPGKTFVDVGANLGIYALVASRIVGPAGRVIAFEPSLQSFSALQRNIALNDFTNLQAFPAAVSDKTGRAFLYHGPDPGQNSLGRDPHLEPKAEEVVTQSLDQVLAQAAVGRVHVIKMDVEGAEELVLRGATRAITSDRPAIIFEINQEASARLGLSPHGATHMLARLGYEFFKVRDGVLFKPKPPITAGNVVAIFGSFIQNWD